MAKYDLLKLIRDLKTASAAAVAAAREGVLDDGTCNFDSAVLELPGAREANVLVAFEQAGRRGVKLSGRFWKGCFSLDVPADGNAHRRTIQAEAMKESLKANGWHTRMYYQMD